jgi:SAM-dependent methyltransferase
MMPGGGRAAMTQAEDLLLLESAPLAWRLAPGLCRKDPASGESCAWVHGFWQYLRLLGLASTPGLHVNFFSDALTGYAGGSAAPRVLISGAADYSMLARVLGAFRARGLQPEITVVDRCETPLMLNRWFAERAEAEISTRHCDIFDFSEARPYDAVCTHSFLSEFPRDRWPRLVEKWRELLRPGGAAITINRVRPGSGQTPSQFTPEQAGAFRAAVSGRVPTLPEAAGADSALLEQAAETYASRRRTWPAPSREHLVALFENAGFRIESVSLGAVASGTPTGISGPTTPGNADYARVVAIGR